MSYENIVDSSLKDIRRTVDLFPAPGGDTPETIGTEAFFAKYPAYLQHYFGTAYRLVREGRALLDNRTLAEQKIGGAIIRAHYEMDELERLEEINVR